MILEFKNSALAILGTLAISISAASPSISASPSAVKSVVVVGQNGSKTTQNLKKAPPGFSSKTSVKILDERNADWFNMNLRSVSGKTMPLRAKFHPYPYTKPNKPIFMVLSATWCPPCMHELSFLASMQKTLADKMDVLIVFVDEIMSSDQKNPQLKPSLQKFHRAPYALSMYYAPQASEIMAKKGLLGLPSFLLFSPSGAIFHTYTGAKQWDNASVQSELLSHIKETDESYMYSDTTARGAKKVVTYSKGGGRTVVPYSKWAAKNKWAAKKVVGQSAQNKPIKGALPSKSVGVTT